MSVRYLELLNKYEGDVNGSDNIFLDKIDIEKIGITGHSQGGFGVVNAITTERHASSYKAAVILSCGNTKPENIFQWEADATMIKAPTMMISSTGNTDSIIASLDSLKELYNNIPSEVNKIMARRNDADHGEMLYYADGYDTAWFRYYLAGDMEAGNAFFTKDAEILKNSLYQDIKIEGLTLKE